MNSRNLTLGQVTATFVPSGLYLVAALMAAEMALDIPFQRMIYSVWAAMAMLIPALCLFWWPARSSAQKNYWLLCWTFAYLLYLVHFYYAVMVHYHASIPEVFREQGTRIASSNFIDTIWWGLDVVLAWVVTADHKWIRIERFALHIFLPMTFFVASVVIFKGFVNVLGYAMTAGLLISWAVRIREWWVVRHQATFIVNRV